MDDGDGDGDGDGPPGLSLRVEEDPNFGVARQILGWRGHARTMDMTNVLFFRLGTERWASR